MKVLKVIYTNETDYIVDISKDFEDLVYLEFYNYSTSKKKGKIRNMQKNFGTKNFPLIIIENENLEDIDAVWPENNPEWAVEIGKKLKKYV